MKFNLRELSIRDIRNLLFKKEITCEEIVKYFLARIEHYGMSDNLNAIASINPNALSEARCLDSQAMENKPLYGIPFLVKDNIDVEGMATTAGSLAFADNIASKDAPIVKILKDAGAILLGKTNMSELAYFVSDNMPNGYSSFGGQVLNAYDKNHDPGGSSSGSAVALSAGLCAFSLGTDTLFSVIGCATENGIIGFKPSIGDISQDGIIPISKHLDSIGIFTKDISDLKEVLKAVLKDKLVDLEEKEKTLAINVCNRDLVSKQQLERYSIMINKLVNSGFDIQEICQESSQGIGELMLYDFSEDMNAYLKNTSNKIKTFKDLVDFYENNPKTMKIYGDESLLEAYEYSVNGNETRKKEILEEKEVITKKVKEEIKDFTAVLMTGPTSIMHYASCYSLSIPICVNDEGIPRSAILYSDDLSKLLSISSIIEANQESIPFPLEYL